MLTIDPGAGPCTGKAHGSRLDAQSLAFKKQIVQEYAAGAALNGLARQHYLSRNLRSPPGSPSPRQAGSTPTWRPLTCCILNCLAEAPNFVLDRVKEKRLHTAWHYGMTLALNKPCRPIK